MRGILGRFLLLLTVLSSGYFAIQAINSHEEGQNWANIAQSHRASWRKTVPKKCEEALRRLENEKPGDPPNLDDLIDDPCRDKGDLSEKRFADTALDACNNANSVTHEMVRNTLATPALAILLWILGHWVIFGSIRRAWRR